MICVFYFCRYDWDTYELTLLIRWWFLSRAGWLQHHLSSLHSEEVLHKPLHKASVEDWSMHILGWVHRNQDIVGPTDMVRFLRLWDSCLGRHRLHPFYWWFHMVYGWPKKKPRISGIKETEPWRMDSGDSFFDQFVALGGVSCSTVPSLPATPEIGEVTPCWKTNLNSTPNVYQCACTTYFASCSTHAGNCTKITDPAILWQQAQQANGDSMVYVWFFLGASILCLLPFLSFILWRCFGRSKGTEIVPEE